MRSQYSELYSSISSTVPSAVPRESHTRGFMTLFVHADRRVGISCSVDSLVQHSSLPVLAPCDLDCLTCRIVTSLVSDVRLSEGWVSF